MEDDSVSVPFSLHFSTVQTSLWWTLFFGASAYALVRRKVATKAWSVYGILLLVLVLNGGQTSSYLAYSSLIDKTSHGSNVAYSFYIAFFNLSRTAFLSVLLIIASGFCVTRHELGEYRNQIFSVLATVLITGLLTDYVFFAVINSPESDTYDLSTMSSVTASVWFVGSVLNLAALIHAWVFLFDVLNKELQTLEEEHTAKLPLRRRETTEPAYIEAANPNGYSELLEGPAAAAAQPPSPPPPEEPLEDETVADRLSYQLKKKILSRFSIGVYAYLGCTILVVLLPAFFYRVVQSTLQVLQFVVYIVFCIWLLYIYRPVPRSNYLMVGFSEEDAESRGVTELATGIGMADHVTPDEGDEEAAVATANSPASGALPVSTSSAIGAEPSLPVSVGAGAGGSASNVLKAVAASVTIPSRKEAKGGYTQLPSQPANKGSKPPLKPVSSTFTLDDDEFDNLEEQRQYKLK